MSSFVKNHRQMNKIYTLLTIFIAFNIQAQIDCANGRYTSEVFTNVTATTNIVYGQATNVSNQSQELRLDVYQPTGDVLAQRPLLIFAHGGSFIGGNKESGDVVELCRYFARHGYVTASIQYRLGFGSIIPNEELAVKAVLRATLDMKAAVRFFRKDAATENTFKIDPENIIVGGVSAGAFMAVHLAYLDKEEEMPTYINLADFGGIEGNSGNPGYASNTKAVVNLCGAIGKKSWIESGDVPILSMHGNNDNVVPYGTAMLSISIFPIMQVDGSSSIHEQALAVGVDSEFIPWWNAPHTPFIANNAYMDSTKNYTRTFLAKIIGCETTSAQQIDDANHFDIYPNPAKDLLNISHHKQNAFRIRITDITGKVLLNHNYVSQQNAQIALHDFANGVYFLQLEERNGKVETKRFVVSN